MDELIKNLVETYGPSGFEGKVRDLIRNEIEPYVEELTVDAMGNLIAHRPGDGEGLKVMVAAHMDEIGLMVSHITEKGFLRFTNIGGIRPQGLMGSRVQFSNGTTGVIYNEKLDSWTKLQPLTKHYIDVGATGLDDCPVEVGSAAAFSRSFISQGDRWIAKSMDDRIGCLVVIEALKQIEHSINDIYFVFSVQEEVGTRGAQIAANALQPDVGLAVDVTLSGDTPEGDTIAVVLGGGPAIKVKDSGMIAHTGLVQQMKLRAQEADIHYQLEVLERGSTDARSMQIAGAGSAAGCLSIPTRYVHSQSEVVDVSDVKNSVQLLTDLLSKPINL